MLLFLLASSFFNAWQPELEITGIKSDYSEGDIITYQIAWSGDPPVNQVIFEIEEKPVREQWDVTPAEHSKQSAFFTLGWDARSYQYTATVMNEEGQNHVLSGSFELKQRDAVKPDATLSGIGSDYEENNEVFYKINVTDNQILKRVSLSVLDTPIKELWETTSQDFERQGGFSTVGWATNRKYDYVLQAVDQAGNTTEVGGSFFLKGSDTSAPTGQVAGIGEQHILGTDINYTLTVQDNQALKTLRFIVGDNLVKEIWHVGGRENIQQSMFSTQGWEEGLYNYQLNIIDEADNEASVKGQFTLVFGEDTNPPTGFYSGFKPEYLVGDKITYSVEAHDDKALDRISFTVKGTDVQQTWQVTGTSAIEHQVFSTTNWAAGEYAFAMQIKDKAGNVSEQYTGQFTLNLSKNAQIVGLLEQCQRHYKAGRWTRGRGGNAFACYQQVMQLEPNNNAAIMGIQQIERKYQDLAGTAIARRQWQRANTLLSRLETVNPQAQALPQLRQRLQQAQQASTLAREAATATSTTQLPPTPATRTPDTTASSTRKSNIEEALRNPICEELLTQISIGIEPVTTDQKRILETECR